MDAYQVALEFSKVLVEKFNGLIRVVALFGSRARKENKENSDIDVLVIVDDVYNQWDNVMKAYYYKTLSEIVSEEKFKKLHVTTIPISLFWEMIKEGDPLALNILRKGIPVLDSFAMFASLQRMLAEGKIKPSEEAISVLRARIPFYINMYHFHIAKALEMAYWIFIESAQSALMRLGVAPAPEDIPKYLNELVKSKLLDKTYLKWYESIYNLVHKLAHRELERVSADTVEEWFQRALDFNRKMKELSEKLKNKQ